MWPSTRTFDWYSEQRRSLSEGARRLGAIIAANRKLAAAMAIGMLAIVALLTGYFAWSSRQETQAAVLLFKAASHLASSTGTAEDVKNQEDGIRLVREVIGRYPKTAAAAEATLRLGTFYFGLGNYDEARNAYQGYLMKNPRGQIAFSAGLGVGDTYLAENKYDKAVETYSSLIEQFPQEALVPQAYLNLARTYLSMKREQDAARLYQKVVETYPTTAWAQYAQTQVRKLIRKSVAR